MAKLTLNQAKLRVEREKEKQEAIKKKMEIQEKKELYGENWKVIERQKIEKVIEEEIGSKTAPKIYDSKDLYEYFKPVSFYKDLNGKKIKADFKKFNGGEIIYRSMLQELDSNIEEIDKEIEKLEDGETKEDKDKGKDKDKDKNKDDDTISKEGIENEEFGDGESESDNALPADPERERQLLLKKALEHSEQRELEKLKKESPVAKAKGKLHQVVSTYFNRFVPLYDKQVCTCCGMPKNVKDFYIVNNITCSDRVDSKGNYHLWVCKDCCNKLFGYAYSVLFEKNLEKAMQFVCSYLNLYWDVDLLYKAKEHFEKTGRKGTLLGSYIITINNNAIGKTFIDSEFLTEKETTQTNLPVNPEEAPYDWSKEDARNKKAVIRMVGYDPFSYESEENKKILYRDLLNILDEGMQNDLVKFQAGIQIVLSFFKLREMNETEFRMRQEKAPISDLKALSDLKAKELKAITDFSRDNGFSERYATAKAKGENTLTGIMNRMNEAKYEKAILNRYDIETSATIQQAADASFKAIFSQLGMGESEVWKVTQDQFVELTKLRKENSRLQEELRKSKYREAELNLKEKEREMKVKMGIQGDEVDA